MRLFRVMVWGIIVCLVTACLGPSGLWPLAVMVPFLLLKVDTVAPAPRWSRRWRVTDTDLEAWLKQEQP